MKARTLLLVLLPAFAAIPAITSCSGDDAQEGYDALFLTPSNTQNTANAVRGLWVGSVRKNEADGVDADLDVRMHVADGKLVLACRCRYADNTVLTAGITVAAQIREQDTDLVTTESKEHAPASGSHTCRLQVQAGTLEYHISGRELKFQDNGLPYPQFGPAKYVPPFAKASD